MPNIMGAFGAFTYANRNCAIQFTNPEGAYAITNRRYDNDTRFADPDNPQQYLYEHYKLGFSAASGECGTQTDNTVVPTFENKVYGKSETVQPKSILVYIWKRVE